MIGLYGEPSSGTGLQALDPQRHGRELSFRSTPSGAKTRLCASESATSGRGSARKRRILIELTDTPPKGVAYGQWRVSAAHIGVVNKPTAAGPVRRLAPLGLARRGAAGLLIDVQVRGQEPVQVLQRFRHNAIHARASDRSFPGNLGAAVPELIGNRLPVLKRDAELWSAHQAQQAAPSIKTTDAQVRRPHFGNPRGLRVQSRRPQTDLCRQPQAFPD